MTENIDAKCYNTLTDMFYFLKDFLTVFRYFVFGIREYWILIGMNINLHRIIGIDTIAVSCGVKYRPIEAMR